MHDRIHQALDGELPADGLTPEERAELHRYRASIGTALGPIRRLPSIDVVEDVRHRLAPRPGPFRWLWAPRTLTFRPAFALAGALALALAVFRPLLQPATPAPGPARVIVQFRLGDAEAREVALVGDFNGWRPEHRLHRSAAGVWAVDVALEPGVYSYVFLVDGEAIRLDPLAPRVTDGFGGASSRLSVLAPERRS
ncbi:MAG TPA: glycogen-binding domain-containing protein [Gemmatimonadales bacterium]